MRIAVVHSFYKTPPHNGEDRAVQDLVQTLSAKGQTVELIARRSNDLISEPLYAGKSALTVASGRGRSPLETSFDAFGPISFTFTTPSPIGAVGGFGIYTCH